MKTLLAITFAGILAAPALAAESGGGAPVPSTVFVGVNKSAVLENSVGVKRISIANPALADAVAVNRNEILLNGKAQGTTSMVMWDVKGQRTMYEIHIDSGTAKPDVVREELKQELPGQDVTFDLIDGTVFLRGTVNDIVSADRAAALVATLGKVVNLLRVKVPDAEPQIMLKVRFANVNRTATQQLGFNLASTGATNTIGSITTGQFGGAPHFDATSTPPTATFTDLLNIFLYRKDLNLAGTIRALETKQLLQILAEPNLLTVSGHPASFLAGGEFPFPTLQGGGAGVGQITVQFREFGIRIHFLPTVTPRGTIRLAVMPEVSSLDYSNSLTVGGVTVPGLSTRRVQSEVELESGQSFVIAGLLDNRTTEILNKIPGLANIPLLGKLFESRSLQKNNSELLVLVTPELVNPIAADAPKPELEMPTPFLKDAPEVAPQNPVSPSQKLPVMQVIPVEVIKNWSEPGLNGAPGPNGNGGGQPIFPVVPNNAPVNQATASNASPPTESKSIRPPDK